MTKATFYLFIASLPACYFTAAPAFITAAVFLALYLEERWLQHKGAVHNLGLESALTTQKREIEELRTQLSAINLRLGMSLR